MALDKEKTMIEFEKGRSQLAGVSVQKRNLQAQAGMIDAAITELEKTKEKTVYKAVGNILVPAEAKVVLDEMKKQKETVDLRVKTVQKQEDALMDKLNKLKLDLEGKKPEGKDNSGSESKK